VRTAFESTKYRKVVDSDPLANELPKHPPFRALGDGADPVRDWNGLTTTKFVAERCCGMGSPSVDIDTVSPHSCAGDNVVVSNRTFEWTSLKYGGFGTFNVVS
jgi:hypothetical protein